MPVDSATSFVLTALMFGRVSDRVTALGIRQTIGIIGSAMGKHRFTDSERFTVYMADSAKCFWCGIPIYYRDVQVDHLFPESLKNDPARLEELRVNYGLGQGFDLNGFENWVTCHQGCNLRKLGDILPNAPAMMFAISEVIQRAPKLAKYRTEFEKDKRRERILVMLSAAVEDGELERSDIELLLEKLPEIPTATPAGVNTQINLSTAWQVVVPSSPAASIEGQGWSIYRVTGNVAYVTDGKFGGYVPNVANPDPSWICSRCGCYGPWDGIICRTCGNREEPD
jgi:hypothetical protein